MKYLFIAAFFLITSFASAQTTKEEKEAIAIEKKQPKIPAEVFIGGPLVADMKLTNDFNTRRIWSAKNRDTITVSQLYDIRLKFKSNKEALKFHQKYLGINSEYGPEIKNHGMSFEGANDEHVYHGSELINEMVKPMGVRMYCFIYVVDNYFVKHYFSCNINMQPKDFQAFITEAIQRIQKQNTEYKGKD